LTAQLAERPSTGEHGDYRDLANAVIKRFGIIIGSERAMRLAANVPGLMLDADGRVVGAASADMLDRLAREYQAVGGTVAMVLMKRTLAPMARDAHLTLPGILQ
jgi:hypothetical protein